MLVYGNLFDAITDHRYSVHAWLTRWTDGLYHVGRENAISRQACLRDSFHASRLIGQPTLASLPTKKRLALIVERFLNPNLEEFPMVPEQEAKKAEKVEKVVRTRCTQPTGADGKGDRCPRKAVVGLSVCWHHTPEKLAARAKARVIKAAAQALLKPAEPAKPAESAGVPAAIESGLTKAPGFVATPGIPPVKVAMLEAKVEPGKSTKPTKAVDSKRPAAGMIQRVQPPKK
jgi:hypothetical protein